MLRQEITTQEQLEAIIEDMEDWSFYKFELVD